MSKICVVCGTDCDGKPRVKDPKGRYYCKPCYDEALEKQREPLGRPTVTGRPDEEANVDLLAELAAAPMIHAAAGVEAMTPCPHCGMGMPGDAIICMNCGANVQTGKAIKTRKGRTRDSGAAASDVSAFLGNPLLWAGAALLMYVLVAVLGATNPDPGVGSLIYSAWHAPFSLGMFVFLLILAFREGVLQGFLTLCIPCYVIYFVYGVTDNAWARILFVVYLLGHVGYYVLFWDVIGPGAGSGGFP